MCIGEKRKLTIPSGMGYGKLFRLLSVLASLKISFIQVTPVLEPRSLGVPLWCLMSSCWTSRAPEHNSIQMN